MRQLVRLRMPVGDTPPVIRLAFVLPLAFVATCTPGAARSATPCANLVRPLAVEQFIASPYSLLQEPTARNPDELSGKIRNYALEGPLAVAAIVKLVARARDDQRKPIAKGLAQAANECRSVDPSVSRAIMDQAQHVTDAGFRHSFYDYVAEGQTAPPRFEADAGPARRTLPLSPGSGTKLPPLSNPFEPLNTLKLR